MNEQNFGLDIGDYVKCVTATIKSVRYMSPYEKWITYDSYVTNTFIGCIVGETTGYNIIVKKNKDGIWESQKNIKFYLFKVAIDRRGKIVFVETHDPIKIEKIELPDKRNHPLHDRWLIL